MLSEEGLKALANHGNTVGEMAREILISRWTEISVKNPLRMGDQTFYWEGGRVHVTVIDHDYAQGDPCPYTHRRPLNLPPAIPRP